MNEKIKVVDMRELGKIWVTTGPKSCHELKLIASWEVNYGIFCEISVIKIPTPCHDVKSSTTWEATLDFVFYFPFDFDFSVGLMFDKV